MKKKILILILILSLAASFLLTACNDNKSEDKLRIIFLGDSVGEGVAGMAPISERERDAYFGSVSLRNGYEFRNRAISGSRSRQLLDYIQVEDEGIWMTQSLIRSADVIHVSILGNDIMLSDISEMVTGLVKDDEVLLNKVIDTARDNIAEIVRILKEYNPDAILIIQTVYNPIFGKNILITPDAEVELAELGIGEDGYRALASEIIVRVNAVIHQYLALHPGAFHIVDGFAEYDRIYREDPERGRDLIFVDDAHPSSEGHGVLADLNQTLFEELGLADAKSALKKYKSMRIEQLERIYSKRIDVRAAKREINRAKTKEEVTELYYDLIDGILPNYL
ncbi:MAG: SGNH/GDSL hydrolase family protein [Clostridia bacterium]